MKMLENKLKWYSAVAATVIISSSLLASAMTDNQDPDISEKLELPK